jgi:peptidyl-prolyl cis-trans isomerase C
MINKACKHLIIALFLVSSFTACQLLENPENEVVITVGSRQITDDELKKDIRLITLEMDLTDQEVAKDLEPLINRAVENYLILEYGKAEEITVPSDELEAAIRNLTKDYPDDVFQEMLINRYIDLNKWKEGIRQQLLIQKITSSATMGLTPVSFEEIKQYYESHLGDFKRPRMVELRQVVTADRKEAEAVLGKLTEGADMAQLARDYSITPEGDYGGMLGWIARGDLDEDMEKSVFSVPVGKFSPVLESSYGYHVFEVLAEQQEGMRELPEVMSEIEEELFQQKREFFYVQWLKKLRETFPVKIDKDLYNNWSIN